MLLCVAAWTGSLVAIFYPAIVYRECTGSRHFLGPRNAAGTVPVLAEIFSSLQLGGRTCS